MLAPNASSSEASIIELEASQTEPLFELFLAGTTSPQCMQSTTAALTRLCVSAAQAHDSALRQSSKSAPWTLIPVLRGALPMYVGAQSALPEGHTNCVLVRCHKVKETTQVAIDWLGHRPYGKQSESEQAQSYVESPIVLLDTIIATGDTILKLCDELWELAGESGRRNREKSLAILTCYAAPDALDRIARHPIVRVVVAARKAESCDEKGYLVPYTHGDIGDKLYGAAPSKTEVNKTYEANDRARKPSVSISAGEDENLVRDGVAELIDETAGGCWNLTDGGAALTKKLTFRTFKAAWNFMSDVAAEAGKNRHHPEWSNVYNKVSVKWTTHEPHGLSKKDVDLARITDARAAFHDALSPRT